MALSATSRTFSRDLPSRAFCIECDALVPVRLEDHGDVLCSSCMYVLSTSLSIGAAATHVERASPATRDGPSESGMCPAWLHADTGEVIRVEQVICLSDFQALDLIPCLLQRHVVNVTHAWDF